MFKYIVPISLLCLSLTSVATPDTAPAALKSFSANYEATWEAGWFPITIDASRELTQLENGVWQLTFEAYSSIADLHEQSLFKLENNTIKPQSYRYKTSGFLSKTRRAQTFDWEKKKVFIPERDEWTEYELKLGIQDNLSYQEQIRLDLLAGKTEFIYQLAYKNRLKEYRFTVANIGQTKTKQGLINTVEIEQKKENSKESTRIWFAIDYDYILIKLKTKQKNGDSNTISLKKAQIGEKTLQGF